MKKLIYILILIFCLFSTITFAKSFGLDLGLNLGYQNSGGPSSDGLLLESGDYLLLESGDYLLLE